MPSKTTIAKLLDPKAIEKRNAAFHRMSKKRQRVAIAEDVLSQLRMKKYVAAPGTYVQSDALDDLVNGFWDPEKGQESERLDLQVALLGKAPECNVCGLGAAFCSMARLGDELELADVGDIHEKLEPIFGGRNMALIESSFEGDDFGSEAGVELSDEELSACTRFYNRYADADKRLAAIFRNVVKNEGNFKP